MTTTELQAYTLAPGDRVALAAAFNRRIVTQVNIQRVKVAAAWSVDGTDRFLVLLEGRDTDALDAATAVMTDELQPVKEVERLRLSPLLAPSHVVRMVEEEDRSLADPEPAPWSFVELSGDGETLWVGYKQAPGRGLHHVEVTPEANRVRITVYLGKRADVGRRPFPLVPVGMGAWAAVHLDGPLGDRALVDGTRPTEHPRRPLPVATWPA